MSRPGGGTGPNQASVSGTVSVLDRSGSGLAPNVNSREDTGDRCGDVTSRTGQSGPLRDKEGLSAGVHVCTLPFSFAYLSVYGGRVPQRGLLNNCTAVKTSVKKDENVQVKYNKIRFVASW